MDMRPGSGGRGGIVFILGAGPRGYGRKRCSNDYEKAERIYAD